MKTFFKSTDCDTLEGVARVEYYPEGGLKECILSLPNTLQTPIGPLVPQYETDVERRKFTDSFSCFESGVLKSVALHEQTEVPTPLGPMPAELVTFYESGAVNRVFPQNGRISGFWSEENEYQIAPVLTLKLPYGDISMKLISLHFYESGMIKGITIWPRDHLDVPTPVGNLRVRTGISFYESGAIKSVEPGRVTLVDTPIGPLKAFDLDAVGISADQNSLCFTEEGGIESLKTAGSEVLVETPDGRNLLYQPATFLSHFDDSKRIEPMVVRFQNGSVCLNGLDCHDILTCRFMVSDFKPGKGKTENGCAGCGQFSFGD